MLLFIKVLTTSLYLDSGRSIVTNGNDLFFCGFSFLFLTTTSSNVPLVVNISVLNNKETVYKTIVIETTDNKTQNRLI